MEGKVGGTRHLLLDHIAAEDPLLLGDAPGAQGVGGQLMGGCVAGQLLAPSLGYERICWAQITAWLPVCSFLLWF